MSAADAAAGSTSEHACSTEGCTKASNLRCPTCKDLGLAGGYFCSQECFKSSWATHKMLHQLAKKLMGEQMAAMAASKVKVPKSFEGYSFTGKLRPGDVSPMMRVSAGIRKPDYADSGLPAGEMALRGSNMIPVHKGEEIEHLRKAGRLAREVLDIASAALRPGITGDELDRIVFAATVERGCYPSPLNYHGFPKSFCVSVNEVICHGIPDSRPLEDGDIVNLDVTVYTPEGFHADLNETYAVGNVDARGRKLIRASYDALAAAVAVCRPGVMYRDLGTVISRVAGETGFSVVRSFCGHGIGRLFHGAPNVPHYAKNKAVGIMKAGHVFTIEPMINEGTHSDEVWPDNWTAVTRDGKRSAQFEQMLLVTETGVEILTARQGADRTKMTWDDSACDRPLPAGGAGAGSSPAPAPAEAAAAPAAASTS